MLLIWSLFSQVYSVPFIYVVFFYFRIYCSSNSFETWIHTWITDNMKKVKKQLIHKKNTYKWHTVFLIYQLIVYSFHKASCSNVKMTLVVSIIYYQSAQVLALNYLNLDTSPVALLAVQS